METQEKKLTKVSLNSDLLQLDLMIEILKRLPLKTLIRFLCVSKLWATTIRSGYFNKLFLNDSLTRPKSIIFTTKRDYNDDEPISSVVIKNTHEATSYSYACTYPSITTYHVTCYTRSRATIVPSVHGLICYGPASRLVVFNPSTRRSVILPKVDVGKRATNEYIGYDPIGNDYKVLCIMRGWPMLKNKPGLAEKIRVLTLGTHENSWRMMTQDAIPPHSPQSQELCLNGVLYYRAFTGPKLNDSAIMSFDVRSEKLGLIKGPCKFRMFSKLTSYEGKLAVIFFEKKVNGIIGLWVLEDASKEEWSTKKTFDLPCSSLKFRRFQILQTTDADTSEVIFTPAHKQSSLYSVIYCDLNKSTVRNYKFAGATDEYIYCNEDSVSSSLVENLMFLKEFLYFMF